MRAIVNLITEGKEGYRQGQDRLRQSLVGRFDGDFFGFVGEQSVGAPFHTDNPYAFKLYAIDKVHGMGYDQVLWLDASVYAVSDVYPVFDWLSSSGVFMEHAGHFAGTWSPGYVLDYFNITKQEADQMPMFAAGYCGIDFSRERAFIFFANWWDAMQAGMFKGGWDISRHDMTCASIIANQMGLVKEYSPGGQFFSYVGPGYGTPSESSVFHLQGL